MGYKYASYLVQIATTSPCTVDHLFETWLWLGKFFLVLLFNKHILKNQETYRAESLFHSPNMKNSLYVTAAHHRMQSNEIVFLEQFRVVAALYNRL